MHGIVSLLDEPHYQKVEALWAEMARRFGVRGISQTPYPHFSYHVTAGYAEDLLPALLERFARETQPFKVVSAGIGLSMAEPTGPGLGNLH